MILLYLFLAFAFGYFTHAAMNAARRADDQSETLSRKMSWPNSLK